MISVVSSIGDSYDTSLASEVTSLFRALIGVDNLKEKFIVRLFSCKYCYRAWWRRVRLFKQVSVCYECNTKYEPIPLDKEFGIGEFECYNCHHKFKHWCQKETILSCKKCYIECKPLMIKPYTKSQEHKNPEISRHLNRMCSICYGTQLNLQLSVSFKPTSYHFTSICPKRKNKFCPECRKIPFFSDIHVSTGSTLPSLSYQSKLDQRFIDEDFIIY